MAAHLPALPSLTYPGAPLAVAVFSELLLGAAGNLSLDMASEGESTVRSPRIRAAQKRFSPGRRLSTALHTIPRRCRA